MRGSSCRVNREASRWSKARQPEARATASANIKGGSDVAQPRVVLCCPGNTSPAQPYPALSPSPLALTPHHDRILSQRSLAGGYEAYIPSPSDPEQRTQNRPRDRRYMLDIYFYREFMGHINDGDTPPSHISNDRLVMKSANGVPSLEEHAKFAAACAARDMGPIPRPDLRENKDVVLLCQGQWDYLASIYGGGPALECLCVSARRGDGNHTHPTPSPAGLYLVAHSTHLLIYLRIHAP